jgi:carbon monoxide dehydrogenase subunit G
MDNKSYFESRTGNLTCSTQQVFTFVSDLRNFERFVPPGTINNWKADKDNCSFTVSMIGSVSVRILKKEEYSEVVYNGDALSKNDFTLRLDILENHDKLAKVKLSLNAELNQMMKMIAAKPITQFLEILIKEMESFDGWNEIIK